jgi:tight adherence protein B
MNLQAKIRVYSAQGRLTGVILTALPLICYVAISFLDPKYTRLLVEDELGRRLVYFGLAGLVVGSALIQRIVRIKV